MLVSLLLRWLAAFVLVVITYNPTELNYVRWALGDGAASLPLVILFGVILLVGYVIFLRATFRSIGGLGILLVVALVGAFLWVLYDFNIISLENPGALTWIGLVAVSFIMGVGLSWSIIRRGLSGQLDVDDVEE
ncbi:DUF6524 family protein [Algicella marina]|uniref:Uncharacterized protein n=1 Tax=Algicella marina TaxID=2683284 RepID=A0A6P1T0B7_9RHOB|nr:DUF6524 family protein [Algicella marina]QHQ35073.1 hypothetical protein GO499_07620 [Algicella marina]